MLVDFSSSTERLYEHLSSCQVIYGAAITDPTSASIFAALTEHWIHTGGPKKEMGRYHLPVVFFTPGTRLNGLLQAVENASPPLVQTAELCGLYYSPIVSGDTTMGLHESFSILYCRTD